MKDRDQAAALAALEAVLAEAHEQSSSNLAFVDSACRIVGAPLPPRRAASRIVLE